MQLFMNIGALHEDMNRVRWATLWDSDSVFWKKLEIERIAMFTLIRLMLSLVLVASSLCAAAEDFPSKPVRLIVPFSPGGTLDAAARLIALKLQDKWGQPVIVENRTGASGAVGIDYVVRSKPDGYTLLYNNGMVTTTIQQLQRTTFDVNRDLLGVVQTVENWQVLAVNTKLGVSTMGELIELARKQPGRLTYGSGGTGSGLHLYMERVKSAAKIDIRHIPYKGSAPATLALMTGEVDMVFDVTSSMLPLIKSGKVIPLMVTGDKRLETLPNVPTMESLIPGIGTDTGWHGIFAPAGTPKDIVNKIASDVRAVMLSPDLSARFREMDFKPTGLGPEQLGAIVRSEYEHWGKLIRANNIRSE
jgi:tripartite-type tricarboxylate transporter receptor subunit TctC